MAGGAHGRSFITEMDEGGRSVTKVIFIPSGWPSVCPSVPSLTFHLHLPLELFSFLFLIFQVRVCPPTRSRSTCKSVLIRCKCVFQRRSLASDSIRFLSLVSYTTIVLNCLHQHLPWFRQRDAIQMSSLQI